MASEKPSDNLDSFEQEGIHLIHMAHDLFSQGRYPASIKQYRKFLKQYSNHPRSPEAQTMIAECYYHKDLLQAAAQNRPSEKLFREAREEYKKAIRFIPKDDYLAESVVFRLSEIDFNLKNYAAALDSLSDMQTRFPNGLLRGESKLLQAQILLAQKKAAEALRVFQSLLSDQSFYKGESRTALTYGIALFETGNSSGALTYLDPLETPIASLYAGRAHLKLGRPLVAVEKFKRVSQLDPQSKWIELSRYFSAEAFFSAKDYRSAVQAYDSFLRSYSLSHLRSGTMYKIGLSQYELEEYLQARGSFQSVLQLAPKNEFAEPSLYMVAESYLREGRYREAGYAYADVAQTYQSELSGRAQFKLGWCYYQLNDNPSAESALRLLLVNDITHPLAPAGALLLGNVLTRQEKYSEAVQSYVQSLDLIQASRMPDEQKTELKESCLALLNRANYLKHDYGSLVSGYQYLLKDFKPTSHSWRAATLLYIAEGYFRQGLYDQSLGIYRKMLESFPAAPESSFAVDGIAWCLFKKGKYKESEEERQKLLAYRTLPEISPFKTILPEAKIPQEIFVRNEFEMATTLFNQKKYLKALETYELFEKDYPDNPLISQAALQAGWCYYRLEYYGQAIKTWEEVEKKYPSSPQAVQAAWSVGDTYFRAQKYERAIATYQRILQTYPGDPAINHARLRIAQSYYNDKNLLRAIQAFESLFLHAPKSPEASQVLDFLTYLMADPESKSHAMDSLSRIADLKPGSPMAAQARFRVAKNLYETADYGMAIQSFEKLIADLSLGEDMVDAQFFLAESYYHEKRHKEASLAYERFTDNFPKDARFLSALFRLGSSQFNLKDYSKAAESFIKIAREYPMESYAPGALFNSALAWRKVGKWEEAAKALTTYLKKYKEAAKTSNAVSELMTLYEENRQFGLAVELIKKQRDLLDKDDAFRLELTYRLAQDYIAMGEEEKAVQEYKALMLAPYKSNSFRLSALTKLGEYYEKKEIWSEALGAYQELVRSATQPNWIEAAQSRVEIVGEKIRTSKVMDPGSNP